MELQLIKDYATNPTLNINHPAPYWLNVTFILTRGIKSKVNQDKDNSLVEGNTKTEYFVTL